MVLGNTDRYTYPDIATLLSERYQYALSILDISFTQWDEFCRPNNPLPPGVSDSITKSERLNTILASLDALEDSMNTVTNNPVPTRDPEFCCAIPSDGSSGTAGGSTPLPVATPVPDVNATPLPNVDYVTHITALETLLAKSELVLNDLLARYGTIQSGAFPDCNPPVVDAPYALPADQSGDALLDQVVVLVNSGLNSLKQSVDLFTANCTRNPQTALQQGAGPANTARDQFSQAREQINNLKAR